MKTSRRNALIALALGLVATYLVGPGIRDAVAAGPPLPKLVAIRAGTRIGSKAPAGWSSLVIKAQPKIESGNVDRLPAFAVSIASLFRSVVLADVGRAGSGQNQYILKRVGIGLCVPDRRADVVIDVAATASLPVSFGFLEKQALRVAESELNKARLIAATETCALLAAPSVIKVRGTHQKIILLYAILVDQETGRLDTVLWSIAAREGFRKPPAWLTLLPRDLVYDCGLDVQAEGLFGRLPMNWSFAMRELPPGRRIVCPVRLQTWLSGLDRIIANPREFEHALRSKVRLDSGSPELTFPGR